jgi:hypothetical protein
VRVSEISTFLQAGSIRDVVVDVSAHEEEFWSKLRPNAFENFRAVLVIVDPEAVSWLSRLSAFSAFSS